MALREYETVCIFKPYSSPDTVEKLTQKIRPYVEEGGGTVLNTAPWGRKRLAYTIGKEREGLYVCLHYAALAAKIAEIEKIMSYDESVLKYLTIKRSDAVRDIAALKKAPPPEVPSVFRPDTERSEHRPEHDREYRN